MAGAPAKIPAMATKSEPAPVVARRSAGVRTRQRMLDIATREFAAKGYAGARIESIVSAARCNKQLLYYYFGSKAALYDEVLEEVGPPAHRRLATLAADTDERTLAEALRRRLGQRWTPAFTRWLRLLLWESLERSARDIRNEPERRETWRRRVAEVEVAQRNAEIAPELDAELLALALASIELMPRILPQVTYMVTGQEPDDEDLRARHQRLVAQLVARLGPDGAGDAAGADADSRST
jgi:TetR/AcrR family transcriptional regulator